MRKVVLLWVILLFSCTERKQQNPLEVTKEKSSESDEKRKKEAEEEEELNERECKPVEKPDIQTKNAFFGADTKIVVGVYTKGYIDTRIHRQDHELKEVQLAHQISLNQVQKDRLFELLCCREGGYGAEAACYSPRHLITFHKMDKQIGCIEICFKCSRSITKDLPFGISCAAHHIDIRAFFDSIGLEKPKG